MAQTLTVPPTASTPSMVKPLIDSGTGRVLLSDISWATYSALLADVGEGAARLTYDHGWLEIEMAGKLHEAFKEIIGDMVKSVLSSQGIDFDPSGSTTWRTQAELSGLEADASFHIQTVLQVADKMGLDLTVDPPPDLAIEIEASSALLDKVEIYRVLRVPELWRIRADGSCDMFALDTFGAYQAISSSVAVPTLSSMIIQKYLSLRIESTYTATINAFRKDFLKALPR